MVTIKDGCGCDPCDCDWKQKLKEAYARASVSVNKVGDFDGAIYYPDGSGFVKLPIPKLSEVQQISQNAQDIADLKVADIQLQANITTEETARKAKDENLDSDIARIDSTDARQSELIQDNADRITSTYNDLVSTEATVATHDSEIITLKASNEALAKSLVSDVIMTDGTTAGSVQVSIEREDGALITSANYKWGRDIGVRLEAGTQAGYIKTVISLSDGTELVSNEYKIVEILESDVYVTAITLVPDMTAGTIGGNISYSNGTTQTINAVNVPTAPGVTSAIEALQGRMTAVEQKNATQDASITAIDGRVQALENTPGIGQFANGRLGTIAGSTTDGRIKAETDGTGSVNGWDALKNRVTAAEGQIVAAQGDISDLDGRIGTHDTEISGIMSNISAIETKNTQQDTAINGKVSIAQGAENAGKALVVGNNGDITLISQSVKLPKAVVAINLSEHFSSVSGTASTGAYYTSFSILPVWNVEDTFTENVTFVQLNTTGYSLNSGMYEVTLGSFKNKVNTLLYILDSLNIDYASLSNGSYFISINGVSYDFTLGGGRGFNFQFNVNNGSISNVTTSGNGICVIKSGSTKANIAIRSFYKSS